MGITISCNAQYGFTQMSVKDLAPSTCRSAARRLNGYVTKLLFTERTAWYVTLGPPPMGATRILPYPVFSRVVPLFVSISFGRCLFFLPVLLT